jgi:hypothetical protein
MDPTSSGKLELDDGQTAAGPVQFQCSSLALDSITEELAPPEAPPAVQHLQMQDCQQGFPAAATAAGRSIRTGQAATAPSAEAAAAAVEAAPPVGSYRVPIVTFDDVLRQGPAKASFLGDGSFGYVSKAWFKDKHVAVKVLLRERKGQLRAIPKAEAQLDLLQEAGGLLVQWLSTIMVESGTDE